MSYNPSKRELLQDTVEHIDIKSHNVVPLVESMQQMAFSARDLGRAADIYDRMLRDTECGVILCLAGSLISAGLKQVFIDMIKNRMVDAIVSTGANIVDQDFFEALGYKHYIAAERLKGGMDDSMLRDHSIDRIYDTLIDEDELRICDETVKKIADELPPGNYSSRQIIHKMGEHLETAAKADSIVQTAYQCGVPIFCPAFSDCSAGLGIVAHYHERLRAGRGTTAFDSAKDFYELTQIKLNNPVTGLLMIGGGVPKNFAQDIVVSADILMSQDGGDQPQMHKYAIQITVADTRDGALSGSTLKEASSWGKVDTTYEQMVFSEATIALPLIAGYAYHKRGWEQRQEKQFARIYAETEQTVG
ncbi:MAG: deoxyhypusine synthase [Pirellulaceae bacterium]|nr:deoxyhypusine synthase [Pirellulaceae bacterium]